VTQWVLPVSASTPLYLLACVPASVGVSSPAPNLLLTLPVVASIYDGIVTHWDDPAIAALNPAPVALPHEPIRLFALQARPGSTQH
jgi:ABC-type phosphate transport system substrate-binding protein